tara:strand:- start:1035 stop:1217 length:183 start_codon:yes stop_codon:yes gene_type:complete
MGKIYLISEMVQWKQDFFRDMYGEEIYGITKDGSVLYNTDNKKISDRVYYTYLAKEEPVE